MIIANEDIRELIAEVPEGHRHLRITLVLHDGREFTFQEATAANLVRAYVSVKTHPTTERVRLTGRRLDAPKEGFAGWQLHES